MKNLRCNVEICKHNDKKKCKKTSIVLDYMGMEANPTCLDFVLQKLEKIKKDIWTTHEN